MAVLVGHQVLLGVVLRRTHEHHPVTAVLVIRLDVLRVVIALDLQSTKHDAYNERGSAKQYEIHVGVHVRLHSDMCMKYHLANARKIFQPLE